MIRNALGPNLDAGIGLGAAQELHLQLENEVFVRLFGTEELVACNLLTECPSYDGTAFNSEDF